MSKLDVIMENISPGFSKGIRIMTSDWKNAMLRTTYVTTVTEPPARISGRGMSRMNSRLVCIHFLSWNSPLPLISLHLNKFYCTKWVCIIIDISILITRDSARGICSAPYDVHEALGRSFGKCFWGSEFCSNKGEKSGSRIAYSRPYQSL